MADDSNARWLARERRLLANVMQRIHDPTFGPVIERGLGSRVWDAAGREYLDLTCGYSAANFGHAFEPLVRAASQQLQQLTHVTGMPHPGRSALAERLVKYCGGQARPDESNRAERAWPVRDKVIFNTSGSRAIETAWKAALCVRPGLIVSLSPSYHGRSLATATLSDSPRIAALTSYDRLAVRRPAEEFAYCAACPLRLEYPACDIACQASLLEWLDREAANISALVVEPALGARGYIAPPAEYWRRVREASLRHGILMIADEIQMGLGRSGHWLLSESQGWQADLVVLGKSLGGGITPISAVLGRGEILDALPLGTESETFAASPLATAVGCEVVHQLESGPWLERAASLGTRLELALQQTSACRAPTHPPARTESLGASATLEFFGCSDDPVAAAAAARRMAERMVAAGLLVHYSGPYGTRIVLLPALTISESSLADVEQRLSEC
jgi:4-aminobutyrate aminotransferase-like enzyme